MRRFQKIGWAPFDRFKPVFSKENSMKKIMGRVVIIEYAKRGRG